MAIYGLQTDFLNKILTEYFGLADPTIKPLNEIYIGLGLEQVGSSTNTEDFDEIFDGKPLGNYKRARIVFGNASEGIIFNRSDIVFSTASEDWTTDKKVAMLGLFDTPEAEDESGERVKPLVVLKLPQKESVHAGETLILTSEAVRLSLTDI